MQLLSALLEQLKGLWNRWTIAQRVGISAAAVTCIAVVAGTLAWATRTDYVVLESQMTPQKGAEVAGLLQNEQIPFELNFSGSTISVPRSQLNQARLALKDIINPPTGAESSEWFGFPGSPADSEQRRLRQLEKRLAQSIMLMKGVKAAVVHISQPTPSPFAVENIPASASIILELAPNGQFGTSSAQSIVEIVSRGVDGLLPENITLADTFGRQLASKQGLASGMNEQLDYKTQLEARLIRNAESLLEGMLGRGKAIVRVTADIDFSDKTTETRVYDNEGQAKRNESTTMIESKGGVKAPTGVAGASQNVTPDPPDSNGAGSYKQEVITADYEVGTTDETVRTFPGRLLRLTISSIVDLPKADEQNPESAASLPSVSQIEETIKTAVGFDSERSDEISVMVAALKAPEDIEPPVSMMMYWQQYQSLIQTGILAAAAFLAFVIGLMLLRKMRPVVVHAAREEAMSIADVRRLQTISDQAKAHPEVVASIVAAWLRESAAEVNDAPAPTVAPARTARRAA
jgi:flagellar M-ring protein FliF